jgi:aminopeptidase YwaD
MGNPQVTIAEEPATVGRASATVALEHVQRLCALGDRFAGQAGDGPSADYVEECLRSYGLEIERTSAKLVTFREKKCSLEFEDGTAIDATAAYYSPSTPGIVSAPLVYVGAGTDESYEGKDVAGAIVVLEEDALAWDMFWLGRFAERAAAHGAVGIVVIHPFPWSYIMSMEFGGLDFSKRFAEPSVPAVAISANGGLRVMAALGAGRGMARLEVSTEIGPCVSDHVAGLLRGTKHPDERVIVLAHRDSPIPPGANDNGSGTACVLEVARLLADHPCERSMVFLSVAGEEGRAEGTAKYVEDLGDDISKVKAAISIDMIGAGGPLRIVDGIQWLDTPEPVRFTQWLLEMLERTADGLGYQLERYSTGAGGDGGRFLSAGVPSAWFWKPDDFRYHSHEDKPEYMDANAVKAAAEITARTLVAVANGEGGE